ncbi:MAG: nitroreductase family protein [Saccharofermentanales bacterium]|jgi:nitroreductase
MSFKELAAKRYSCRQFSDREVDDATIQSLLEVQRLAPTAHNAQSQRIYVLKGQEGRDIIGQATHCVFGAPLFFVICYDRDACWKRSYDGFLGGPVDAVIAGCHLDFAIADAGLASCWVCTFDPAKLREAMQLPDNHIPMAIFPAGYAADDAQPSPSHTDRHPLSDTVMS